jgi:hypothetical protein
MGRILRAGAHAYMSTRISRPCAHGRRDGIIAPMPWGQMLVIGWRCGFAPPHIKYNYIYIYTHRYINIIIYIYTHRSAEEKQDDRDRRGFVMMDAMVCD